MTMIDIMMMTVNTIKKSTRGTTLNKGIIEDQDLGTNITEITIADST